MLISRFLRKRVRKFLFFDSSSRSKKSKTDARQYFLVQDDAYFCEKTTVFTSTSTKIVYPFPKAATITCSILSTKRISMLYFEGWMFLGWLGTKMRL